MERSKVADRMEQAWTRKSDAKIGNAIIHMHPVPAAHPESGAGSVGDMKIYVEWVAALFQSIPSGGLPSGMAANDSRVPSVGCGCSYV